MLLAFAGELEIRMGSNSRREEADRRLGGHSVKHFLYSNNITREIEETEYLKSSKGMNGIVANSIKRSLKVILTVVSYNL